MRLINVETYELEEHNEACLPQYAILSHTWGAHEVSYSALVDHIKTSRAMGHSPDLAFNQKLSNACLMTKLDRFRYLWIDTCCIDKSSSAELSEAINSMYRWYSNAEVCYAYLSDISMENFLDSFHTSRWVQPPISRWASIITNNSIVHSRLDTTRVTRTSRGEIRQQRMESFRVESRPSGQHRTAHRFGQTTPQEICTCGELYCRPTHVMGR